MTSILFENAKFMSFDDADYLMLPLTDINDKIKAKKFIAESKGKHIAEIKKYKRKRSTEANNYAWLLIGKLADILKMNPVEIYRQQISEIGKFSQYLMTEAAFNDFKRAWEFDHIGRFAKIIGESREHNGYLWIAAYYGSSDFNTDEMSILIDNVVQECNQFGIETLPPDHLERIKNEWQANEHSL